jgi:CRP/FNR family transcriptional regulator, cyclic AMP receptor protein
VSATSSPLGGWFTQLPAAERAVLHERGTTRGYRAGSTLFHEGDLSDWVVLLLGGRVKISAATTDGREVVLAIHGAGELLGELSAIDARPRSATATAIDPVDARIVAGEEFRAFMATSSQASLVFLKSLSGRLRDSDRRRVEFIALDSVGRVATQVVELAEQYGVGLPDGTILVDLPLSQDELAGLTGASREAVGKALHLFRSRGWISTARRRITVSDLDGLRSRAT